MSGSPVLSSYPGDAALPRTSEFPKTPAPEPGTASSGRHRVSRFSSRKVDHAYYWMTVPAVILVCVFLYWPFLQGAFYSLTNSQGYGSWKFIGLKNYGAMFQDARVGHAYLFTVFVAVLVTVFVNFIALFLAVLLDSKIAFKKGFRAIYFIPYILSVLVIGYVFKYIFMVPLPALGQRLGIDWMSTSMLTNPDLAWFPVVFLSIWQGVAYSTLLYLAGLQTIDAEVYEAADIDGANAWQRFWRITFPLIGPFFTINMVLSLKNSLGTFDQVVALTGGGPDSKTETVSYLIFTNGLGNGEYAYQMANAVTFFVVLAVLAFVQLKFFSGREKV
ncbi:sugar ABC transporter permease [Bifidobacterium sp. BRDM6]|uniref:Sugar ABC transporter permease n=2 Tax=Bifidobacterium choloepi TaxID=2614131 RepID=A0A6I5NF24_9BIFI|nr:sugar ABC transporter permease [Bifidobacterium choloepi]